ncbi:hypothetical protein AGMMS4956_04460 [Bacteroidia bacterium]|nr:hypothetical protein AGMMS4956_04460 [Bacteroidia bacterium]
MLDYNLVENLLTPARLIAMLPADLAAGEYHLEVRSNFVHSRNSHSQNIKIGRFHKTLTVV